MSSIKDNNSNSLLKQDEIDFSNRKDSDPDSEWEKRVLCSDGNCIGVIGPDGRCKACGKPYDGAELYHHDDNIEEIVDTPSPDVESTSDEEDVIPESREDIITNQDESTTENDSEFDTDSDTEWDNRILCSDGNCIGVIGPDGRCKECGKPYEG